jgi:hypothetical protein
MQQVQNVMAAVEKFDMKIAPQAIAAGLTGVLAVLPVSSTVTSYTFPFTVIV